MATTDDELLELMANGIAANVKELVKRAESGDITAAEGRLLRDYFKDAGGSLTSSQGVPTPAGDSILKDMEGLDEETLRRLN